MRTNSKLAEIRYLLQTRRVRIQHKPLILQLLVLVLSILGELLALVLLRLVLLPLEVKGLLVPGPAENHRLVVPGGAALRVRHARVPEVDARVVQGRVCFQRRISSAPPMSSRGVSGSGAAYVASLSRSASLSRPLSLSLWRFHWSRKALCKFHSSIVRSSTAPCSLRRP